MTHRQLVKATYCLDFKLDQLGKLFTFQLHHIKNSFLTIWGLYIIPISWEGTLMHPFTSHRWLVIARAAGFATRLPSGSSFIDEMIAPSPPGYPLLLSTEMIDSQLVSGAI